MSSRTTRPSSPASLHDVSSAGSAVGTSSGHLHPAFHWSVERRTSTHCSLQSLSQSWSWYWDSCLLTQTHLLTSDALQNSVLPALSLCIGYALSLPSLSQYTHRMPRTRHQHTLMPQALTHACHRHIHTTCTNPTHSHTHKPKNTHTHPQPTHAP